MPKPWDPIVIDLPTMAEPRMFHFEWDTHLSADESAVVTSGAPYPWDSAPQAPQLPAGVPAQGVPARGTDAGVPATAPTIPPAGDRPRDADGKPLGKNGRPIKYPQYAHLPPQEYRRMKERLDRLAASGHKGVEQRENTIVIPPNNIMSFDRPNGADPERLQNLYRAWFNHHMHMQHVIGQFRAWVESAVAADDNHKQAYINTLAVHKHDNPGWKPGQTWEWDKED